MRRRDVLGMLAGAGLLPAELLRAETEAGASAAVGVDSLPRLSGDLTLYLGRGEGGLYENILGAIRKRNPDLQLQVRRGPSSALANTLVAEGRAGRVRADVFWAIDASSLGLVASEVGLVPLPDSLHAQLEPGFRDTRWVPISGRVRTLPYYEHELSAADLPTDVMALPETDFTFAWAPAYGAFQSFVTAMRLLEGEEATGAWLEKMAARAESYAGEFGVVMAVSRGETQAGFANHYYTLRLKQGTPEAPVGLAFTRNDAGCLVNASGAAVLSDNPLATDFVRHLLTREVQSYLAREAYEIPLVAGIAAPEGLPPLSVLEPPRIDLERLADLRPTLLLLRRTGVL